MKFLELLEEKNISFEIKENRLIVYDNVCLSHTQIKKLPKYSMVFMKDVDLSNTQIKKLPKYPIIFLRDLYLNHTPIKELPDNMIVNGTLNINYTLIKELPDNIIVKNYLSINGTVITKIPKNLKIERIYTPIKGKGDIYIQKNGVIVIFWHEDGIEGWEKFFKEKKSFDSNSDLILEDYNVIEQDFKIAAKLLKSWNS